MGTKGFRKVEFVGGPMDGESMLIRSDSPVVRIPKISPPPLVWPPEFTIPQPIKHFEYRISYDQQAEKWFARLSN